MIEEIFNISELDEMKSIEDRNYDKHLYMKSAEEVNELIVPIRQYGISHFSVSKLYRDKTAEILTTHPEASNIFIEMRGYENSFCGDIDDYTNCIAFWDDIKGDCQFLIDYMGILTESYNISHGLVITKIFQNHVEFYYFAGAKENCKLNSFYLNNTDVLESYITQFNDRGRMLLQQSFKERFSLPETENDETLLVSNEFQVFCKSVSVQNISNVTSIVPYKLTQRELQCIERLMEGMSCKQIACNLDISSRTVEKYMMNIKKKTNSKNLYQALSKLMACYSDKYTKSLSIQRNSLNVNTTDTS